MDLEKLISFNVLISIMMHLDAKEIYNLTSICKKFWKIRCGNKIKLVFVNLCKKKFGCEIHENGALNYYKAVYLGHYLPSKYQFGLSFSIFNDDEFYAGILLVGSEYCPSTTLDGQIIQNCDVKFVCIQTVFCNIKGNSANMETFELPKNHVIFKFKNVKIGIIGSKMHKLCYYFPPVYEKTVKNVISNYIPNI